MDKHKGKSGSNGQTNHSPHQKRVNTVGENEVYCPGCGIFVPVSQVTKGVHWCGAQVQGDQVPASELARLGH